MMSSCPPIPAELLKHLKEAFPDSLPCDPETNERILACSIGEQRVIRYLNARFNDQNNPEDPE